MTWVVYSALLFGDNLFTLWRNLTKATYFLAAIFVGWRSTGNDQNQCYGEFLNPLFYTVDLTMSFSNLETHSCVRCFSHPAMLNNFIRMRPYSSRIASTYQLTMDAKSVQDFAKVVSSLFQMEKDSRCNPTSIINWNRSIGSEGASGNRLLRPLMVPGRNFGNFDPAPCWGGIGSR